MRGTVDSSDRSSERGGVDGWAVLDALAEGLAAVDSDGKLRWLNPAMRRLDPDGCFLVGEDLLVGAARFLSPGEQRDELGRGLREVLHGRSQRLDIECGYAGSRRASIVVMPCTVAGDRGALFQVVDATARTSAEAEVRESEARWRRLVDGSPDVVFISDDSSRMIYANRALEEQSGYTVADFQMPQSENQFIHADDRHRVARFILDFLASERTYSDRIENRFVTKQGNAIWVSSVVAKTAYQGRPALQYVCHNVTAEKQALEESARRLREAEEAIRSRDEFLSIAAHELKTPLTSLRGYAQLLTRKPEPEPEQLQRALRVIDRQVGKLARLINRLLDLSQIEEGRLTLDRQPADLMAVAKEAIATANRPGQCEVELTGPPALPASVDPLRLEQVITNLVENALRHGPPGVAVRVQVRSSEEQAEIDVIDRGPGIPPEERERIFERFYRVPGHDSPGGLGLGLFISREIVRLHGGQISVEPADGGGARFHLSLPLGAPAATPAGGG